MSTQESQQPQKTPEAAEKPPRSRAIPLMIIILATVIGVVSVLGLWVKRQALETETFTRTAGQLIEDEDIRNALDDFIVSAIYDNVDVEAQVAKQLPPKFQGLAAPAAAGLRQVATDVTAKLLAQPKFHDLWRQAAGGAQERLIALLEDKGEFTSSTDGTVTLDLTSLITATAAQVGINADIASKLPPAASQIEILRSDELSAAQTGMKALKTAAYVLSFLTLLLYGLAIWLARGRRRETLRAVGYSFILIGVLVLLARTVAGNIVTDALSSNSTADPAVDSAWRILTSLLVETAQSLVAYGVVIVLAAWLAGPTPVATATRRGVTPYLRRPAVAYGGAAALLVLLFWWDPVVATGRLVPSLLLALLLLGGVEALRRQVIREFPDRVETGSMSALGQKVVERTRRSPGAGPPSADPGEDRVARLERLARLRDSGVLDENEFAAEKQKVLGAA
jgi:hypothetical protein